MAIKTAAELKAYFNTGDKPTESQFGDLIDTIFSAFPIYKVHKSFFKQSGTDDPTDTVLEDNIGSLVWTRASVGFYKAPITGATSLNTLTPFGNWGGNAGTYQAISDQAAVIGYITYYIGQAGELWLEVYDATWTPAEYSTLFTNAAFPIDIKLFN